MEKGFRVEGLGFRVSGLGFRGFEFRGLGSRGPGLAVSYCADLDPNCTGL